MAQIEIMKVLKANRGRKFTTRELSERLNTNFNNVCGAVIMLKKYNMIKHSYNRIGHHRKVQVWL